MPKRFERLSPAELREIHLALALRIAHLDSTDMTKLGPSGKAKIRAHINACEELDKIVQKARGK